MLWCITCYTPVYMVRNEELVVPCIIAIYGYSQGYILNNLQMLQSLMDEKNLWCWAGPWECLFQHIVSESPLVLGDISWLEGFSVTAAFSMLWIQKMPVWTKGGQTDEPRLHSMRLNIGHVGWYKISISKAILQPSLIPASKRTVSLFGRK